MIKVLIAICLTMFIVTFQNCGAMHTDAFASKMSDTDFFSYPFTAAPKFYYEIGLYRAPSDVDRIHNFKFIGSGVYIDDPTKPVSFNVKVKDASGGTVCPTQTGTLAVNASEIEFNCTTPSAASSVTVTLTLSANGTTASFIKTY